MRVLVGLAALAAVEIYVLVLVGSQIGLLGLIGVLLLSAVVGAWAIKREGRRSMTALVAAARSGRPAEAEVADGMYLALAGLLLVVPGLVTTAAALVLLVPPVRRALARRAAARAVRAGSARRGPVVAVVGTAGHGAGYGPQPSAYPGPVSATPRRPFGGQVIDMPENRPDGAEPGASRRGD